VTGLVTPARGTYTVVYRRRSTGGWAASIKEIRGCRGRGPTLRQARRALREALAQFVDEPYRGDFVEDVRLPGPARRLIVHHWKAMRRVEREQARARAAAQEALRALEQLQMSLADARELLGLSHPRVRKLRRSPRIRSPR
jgi:predicted RNase H-like HicB family nuclease